MKAWFLAALLMVAPTTAHAAFISFDTTPGGAGGSLSYDGAGGPAVGAGIVFVDVTGIGTPLNNNVTVPCVGCSLAFTTGANLDEGPTYHWAGGGTFVLTGAVPAAGIAVPTTLLTGTFTQTTSLPGLAAAGTSALFIAVGIDVKNDVLAAFYGLTNPFTFANTEIALDTFSMGADGSFTSIPNQADLINATVPMPMTLVLLGLGLLATRLTGRRRV